MMKTVDQFTCDGGCEAKHESDPEVIELPLGWIRISAWLGDEQGVAQDVDLGERSVDRHYCDGCANDVLRSLAGWKRIANDEKNADAPWSDQRGDRRRSSRGRRQGPPGSQRPRYEPQRRKRCTRRVSSPRSP
jgi:hypothetical protein